jgi:hypothetical protein
VLQHSDVADGYPKPCPAAKRKWLMLPMKLKRFVDERGSSLEQKEQFSVVRVNGGESRMTRLTRT